MKAVFTILLGICALSSFGQALHITSTKFIGGDSACYSQINYAIVTADKGILFAGYSDCNGSGNIPNTSSGASVEGPGDVLIGKLDSNEHISWIRLLGGSGDDLAYSACQTSDDGYAVLCYTESSDGNVSGYKGSGDIWLVKLDANGNLLWSKCYGGPANDQALSIANTAEHGFIILGASNGAGGDVPFHYTTSDFVFDWLLIKTDSVGNKIWSKTIGGTGDENYQGNILVADSGYYIAGSSTSTDHDCTDTSWHAGVGTGYDYYLLKLDTAGNVQWDKSYGGTAGEYEYDAIWDERDSSIVMTGHTTTNNNYMVSGYQGSTDMWVVKADRNGKLKWAKCLGWVGSEDEGRSITTMPNGGYLALGDMIPNIGSVPGHIGQADGWLYALDSAGSIIDSTLFGGTKQEWNATILTTTQGYLALGGSLSMSFTEGVNSGHLSSPSEDCFISNIAYWPTIIANITANDSLQLYPNPAKGIVRVQFSTKNGLLQVMSMQGHIVYKQTIEDSRNSVDIKTAAWSKGSYIVRWECADGTVQTKKLVNE